LKAGSGHKEQNMPLTPFAEQRWSGPQLLLANLILVAVYMANWYFNTLLDLPRGYAAPVFLPAGVGFALVATVGWRVFPGIVLGDGLIHLGVLLPNPGFSLPVALAAAAASTLGAVLQAWLGARWFHRLVLPAIGSARDVGRFLLLAPVMCLVSASVSIAALSQLGVIDAAERGTNWLDWWAGDTIGVLVAAPLTWVVCGQPRTLWRRRAMVLALPLLLAGGAVITLYKQSVHDEVERQLEPYRLKAQQVGDVLQGELHEHERFSDTFAHMLNGDEALKREKFLRIASSYVQGRPEIIGLNWMVPVRAGERAAFEAWVRATVDPGFAGVRELGPDRRMHPAAPQALYLPLLYTWPPANNLLRGMDFLTAPGRTAAVRRTMDTRLPSASQPLTLVSNGHLGTVLFRAVGERGGPMAGMLGLVLDAPAFVNRAVQRSGFSGFDVSLTDITEGEAPSALVGAGLRGPRYGDYTIRLAFAGRDYQLRFSPTAAYLRQGRGMASWLVMTAGLLLTGLLGALVLLMSGERALVEAQVADRTVRLRDREARLQAILDNAADAIVTVDADGVLVSANAATAALFGYPPAHLIGLPFINLFPAGGDDSGPELLARLARAPDEERELDGVNARGEPFPLSVSVARVMLPGERLHVCILRDLTEQRRSQAHIHRLAHHDPLTGLENRNALGLRLERQLAQARRSHQPMAVLFIDLDHFKKINDSHGHEAGDQLLLGAATRMKDLLRDVDTLARLGGDEFIIVLGGPLTPDSVSAVAVRLVDSLQQPYQLNGITAHSGASVGVALFPEDGLDAATLLRHADMAMYAAKREGRNNFQFFSPAMNAATHEHVMLENRMWAALEHGGFELYLQAQVALDTGRIIGAEVLLRWHDAELGEVEPSRFIPIAEESGLIQPLGDWVLARSMALLSEWRREGLGNLRLAVNLSARQFTGGALIARLDQLLAQHPIDPSQLELEITETAAMRDAENTRALLRQLRARGFKLAIDDFGTGYSSLAYLKLFAIDRIKIDRAFVRDIETNPNDAAIVGATIGLAHSLGLSVVAEGVETLAQWGFLRDKRGDEAQGYLFGRPMPAAEFRASLKERALPVPGP
jgi:diguanylate cyclase (GGDEF)-like protein/PAS domain S-box-containing protein